MQIKKDKLTPPIKINGTIIDAMQERILSSMSDLLSLNTEQHAFIILTQTHTQKRTITTPVINPPVPRVSHTVMM